MATTNPISAIQCGIGVVSLAITISDLIFDNDKCADYWELKGGCLYIHENGAFSCSPYPWGDKKNEINKLVIGSGVTTIPANAFQGYTNLQEVHIANSSTTLSFGNGTYNNFHNSSIGNLYLGRNISYSYTDSPFENNTLLTSLEIGNNVTAINTDCFRSCSKLSTVTFGSGLVTIGNDAFNGCNSFASPINIPQGVTSIGNNAFNYCTKSTSLVIPNTVASIGYNAFQNCTSLQSVRIENGKDTLNFGNGTYNNFHNSSIGSLYLGRNISYLYNDSPFESNTKLTSLEIGNNVTAVNTDCFNYCSNLRTVTFGNGLITIGDNAFNRCDSLSSSLQIPIGVTSIGNNAFNNCTKSTSLIIPNTVSSVGYNAFQNCTSLQNVKIEDGTTTLSFGNGTYNNFHNSSIGSLYLGRNISYLYNDSPFESNTKLTSLEIGNNVTTINADCFRGAALCGCVMGAELPLT